jgi:hypothetical protein
MEANNNVNTQMYAATTHHEGGTTSMMPKTKRPALNLQPQNTICPTSQMESPTPMFLCSV